MKIVYASASLIPSRFANSIQVMKMCQAFAKNGHDVTLLAFRRYGGIAISEKDIFDYYGVKPCFRIRLLWTPEVKGRSLIFTIPSIRQIRKERPDLVYGRNLFSAAMSVMLGYKTIYETHTPYEEGGLLGRYLLNRLMKSKNLIRIVVISDALRNMVKDQLGDEKILVAHDAADLLANDILHCSPDILHGRTSVIKIGYIGHLYPGRGVEIICSLSESFRDVDFHIIGGLDKDIEYWKTKVSEDNLFFHGFAPPYKLPQFLLRFDILLMPYQQKVVCPGLNDTSKWMSPMKMFEYMSAGKAIIASDLPVLREVLKHESNALLVPPDDINEWKLALHRLIEKPELRKKLGNQALKDLQEHYTWRKRVDHVLEAFLKHPLQRGL